MSDSYFLRGGACNHQDSPIGSGNPLVARLAAVRYLAALLDIQLSISQFPEGLLNEAFRKLFRSHAAGGSVRRDSFINLA